MLTLIFLISISSVVIYAMDFGGKYVRIKLMTYNVRNCRGLDNVTDYDRVAQIINRTSAEFVALQELDSATERSNQLVVLDEQARRTGMISTYSASIPYMGGKYGVGILTREKPLNVVRVPLPGKEEKRSLLIVETKKIVFCCTHLSLTHEDRLASVSIIEKATRDLKKPVIIAGDFNADPDSEEIKQLLKDWEIINDTSQFTIPANHPAKCIDYIIIRKDNKTKTRKISSVVGNEPVASDHLPVWVEVAINE